MILHPGTAMIIPSFFAASIDEISGLTCRLPLCLMVSNVAISDVGEIEGSLISLLSIKLRQQNLMETPA